MHTYIFTQVCRHDMSMVYMYNPISAAGKYSCSFVTDEDPCGRNILLEPDL